MAELIPHLGDPVDVQRRLEFSIAEGLEWTVLCYLDLETLKVTLGGEPAPTVVDFKVKNSLITQDQADSDPQAGLYRDSRGGQARAARPARAIAGGPRRRGR